MNIKQFFLLTTVLIVSNSTYSSLFFQPLSKSRSSTLSSDLESNDSNNSKSGLNKNYAEFEISVDDVQVKKNIVDFKDRFIKSVIEESFVLNGDLPKGNYIELTRLGSYIVGSAASTTDLFFSFFFNKNVSSIFLPISNIIGNVFGIGLMFQQEKRRRQLKDALQQVDFNKIQTGVLKQEILKLSNEILLLKDTDNNVDYNAEYTYLKRKIAFRVALLLDNGLNLFFSNMLETKYFYGVTTLISALDVIYSLIEQRKKASLMNDNQRQENHKVFETAIDKLLEKYEFVMSDV